MSREIKFRAWHDGLKKMFSAEEMAADQMCLLPTGYFINVHSEPRFSNIDHSKKMLPLQFTGLKDKNGKEIYEGDIVNTNNGKARIEWQSRGYFNAFRVCELSIGLSEGSVKDLEIEVIGNLYENPELLKAERRAGE